MSVESTAKLKVATSGTVFSSISSSTSEHWCSIICKRTRNDGRRRLVLFENHNLKSKINHSEDFLSLMKHIEAHRKKLCAHFEPSDCQAIN